MTFFEPVRSAAVLARQLLPFRSPLEQTGKWWIPLALLTWTAAATLGRTTILRRANRLWSKSHTPIDQERAPIPSSTRPEASAPRDPSFRPAAAAPPNPSSRPEASAPPNASSQPEAAGRSGETPVVSSARAAAGVPGELARWGGEGAGLSRPNSQPNLPQTALYTLLRALAFLLLLTLWLYGLLAAIRSTVTHRLYANAEPNLVLLTAEAVALTLAAFLLWSTTVWHLDLKPLERLTGLNPQTKQLRSKLIETNLVLGIVRVILLVLALTFSASPLPFQSSETQAYINVWWIGVAAFYILGSDFFHVVRRVTYLRLLQSIAGETHAVAAPAS